MSFSFFLFPFLLFVLSMLFHCIFFILHSTWFCWKCYAIQQFALRTLLAVCLSYFSLLSCINHLRSHIVTVDQKFVDFFPTKRGVNSSSRTWNQIALNKQFSYFFIEFILKIYSLNEWIKRIHKAAMTLECINIIRIFVRMRQFIWIRHVEFHMLLRSEFI